MNFDLTEERLMLRDSLRRLLRDRVTPDLLAKATASERGHSPDLWQALTELGVQGALLPAADGGFGGDGFDIAVVFEEFGRAGTFEPMLGTVLLAGGLLAALGNPAQRAMLDDILSGRIVALAHAEPRSRFDLAHVETRAERRDGGWSLTGVKSGVVAAAAADGMIVSARTSGATAATDGISLFLLPAGQAGVTARSYPLATGGQASDVFLDGVHLPDGARLGPVGAAFPALEQVHARAIAAHCAESVGLMEAVKDLTVGYLRTRKQFGQPIGKFQALQHRMADMLIEIEQSRSACINCCGHLSAPRDLRELHVSAAMNLVVRTARLVAEESIQMHGGIGMTMEYALGHLAKRLSLAGNRFGDADWHVERFIRLSGAA